ncbi:MAG: hypothetical protein EZS28_021862 [Streblomastix strix]|uniref:FHA domain-containing protein n=1 Tax=Streblomastix strix TaxID=222440 RepID=A0A5J4VK67_9EUKA|nr:MAG: hypothetical protein EZS28_021862 [Streblomastix strix]
MLVLVRLSLGQPIVYILNKREITIGRVDKDIIVNDPSVSRGHAKIELAPHAPGTLVYFDATPSVTITDSSKFGTSINNKQISKETPTPVEIGSLISLSANKVRFVLMNVPLCFCLSSLTKQEKQEAQEKASIFGRILERWTDSCTHLVMRTASFTEKFAFALISCKPIVKPEYLTAIETLPVSQPIEGEQPQILSSSDEVKIPDIQQITEQLYTMLPRIIDFIPDLDASIRSSPSQLHPDKRRKQLFRGMKFLFLSPNLFTNFSKIVLSAGGEASQFNYEIKDKIKWKLQLKTEQKDKEREIMKDILQQLEQYIGYLGIGSLSQIQQNKSQAQQNSSEISQLYEQLVPEACKQCGINIYDQADIPGLFTT